MSTLKDELLSKQADFNKTMDELVEAAPVLKEMIEKIKPVLKEVVGPGFELFIDTLYGNKAFDRLVVTGVAAQLAKAMLSNSETSNHGKQKVANRALGIAKLIVEGAKE